MPNDGHGFSETSRAEQVLHDRPGRTWRLWPWIALAAALLAVVASRFYGSPSKGFDGVDHPAVGKRLEGVALEPLTGKPASVDDDALRGRVALMNFWGWWCGPCLDEFPHLAELESHFRNDPDFRFVSVATNPNARDSEGLAESTTEFLRSQGSKLATYHDPTLATHQALVRAASLEGFGYPTTVLVDRDGAIRALWVGYRKGLERDMRQAVDDVLAEVK